GRVRLVPGYGIIPDFPAWDGLNNLAPAFGPTGGQWKLVEGDILAMGRELLRSKLPVLAWGVTEENMGWYLNGLCLYLEMPEKGDGRFVLYLDEIKIEGESVPVEKYLAEVEKKWEPARARIKEQINAWEKRLSDLEKVLAGLGDLKGDEAVQDIREKLPHVRRRIITAESCGFIPPAQVGEMEGYFREIQQVIARTKKARGL
ncbi:MAG TPA: hypothetical protein PKW42_02125, partial [bacterium]|nr:hypothetical protein [bacterium]